MDTRIMIVIPSLEPNNKLTMLLDELAAALALPENSWLAADVVLVDDGSGPAYAPIFGAAQAKHGCTVLTHAVNLGKGRALKTAFNHALGSDAGYIGAVTADSDGQHAVADIIACAQALRDNPDKLVLGCRNFDEAQVPFHNRYGNKITRRVFQYLCGVKVTDTQTGLRAIPTAYMRRLMTVPGERFEFEMNMLIECRESRVGIVEVPIRTIYEGENRGSHFNPLRDSFRVYLVFLKYILSSLSSAVVDLAIYSFLQMTLRGVLAEYIMVATVAARVVSSVVNYIVNRKVVFGGSAGAASVVKYYTLAIAQMLASGALTSLLFRATPLHEVPAKIFVDVALFFVSFLIQRAWVFSSKTKKHPSA